MQFQHDCAVFEWQSLEECDLTEYQLWAQRVFSTNGLILFALGLVCPTRLRVACMQDMNHAVEVFIGN
jgi:hypothetical protein